MRAQAFVCVLGACVCTNVFSAVAADRAAPIPSKTVEIVVDGPPGPYPKGHAEIVVTIYDAGAEDPASKNAVLASQSNRYPLLALPETFEVEVNAARLKAAKVPSATAFITVTRRPVYVSKTPAALTADSPTHISVVPIE